MFCDWMRKWFSLAGIDGITGKGDGIAKESKAHQKRLPENWRH